MYWITFPNIYIFFSFQELTEMYGGKGERSIEASANIVGLKLPKTYDPNNS